jgi:CDP-diacylglycerol--serine O-phosphatidyltransferase
MLKHIPNILTLLNLLCGTIAVIFAVNNELEIAAYFVFLGIFFDFFDGFAARLLNVSGELGKQLDSLADVVTSGVVPGIVLFQLLTSEKSHLSIKNLEVSWGNSDFEIWPYFGLLFTLAAAYRLAKFNIDERQTSSFIGLPTPAATLVVLSLPLILNSDINYSIHDFIMNKWVLIGLTILLSILMNAETPLFSLKFKNYSWKDNKIKFIYIVSIIVLLLFLKFLAIPIAILLYVLLSLISNNLEKSKV